VNKIIVVDPDVVEETNRSRTVGTTPQDVLNKRPKVEVMARLAAQINPRLHVVTVRGSVYDLPIALKLREADVIFCCTDNLSSRLVLNRMAYQYMIPVIDTGLDIQCEEEGKIRSAGGRVMTLLPNSPCLECTGYLNALELSREIAQIEAGDKPHHSYISGTPEEAPAVISLNGIVASLAVNEFLHLLTGLETQREPGMYKMYRILNGTVQTYRMQAESKCTLCDEVKALGDTVMLPCRKQSTESC